MRRARGSSNVRRANNRTAPTIPKVGGIYEQNQMCQAKRIRSKAPTNLGATPRPREEQQFCTEPLKDISSNLELLMQNAVSAFGDPIEEYVETGTDEELQRKVMVLMKQLHAANEKPPDKSFLQRLKANFTSKKETSTTPEFANLRSELSALEMRMMGVVIDGPHMQSKLTSMMQEAAIDMLWDATVSLLDKIGALFRAETSEPLVVLLGVLMSHIRTAAGKKKASRQSVQLKLGEVLPEIVNLAHCSTLAAMEHQLILMSIKFFGSSVTKRPFIARLRGLSDQAEAVLRQIAGETQSILATLVDILLFAAKLGKSQEESKLHMGNELLHACIKSTIQESVTLSEVQELIILVKSISECSSYTVALSLLERVRSMHERPRGASDRSSHHSEAGARGEDSMAMESVHSKYSRTLAEREDEVPTDATVEEPAVQTDFVHKKTIAKYFSRFDLDGCGEIDSIDDIQMLCTTLCAKLRVPVGPERIQSIVDKRSSGRYTLEEFVKWFHEEFKEESL